MIAGIIFGMMGLGFLWLLAWNVWGCIPLGLSILGLAICLKKIKADPPHLGLITILGQRRDKTKKEGWRFLIPFFYDVIPVDVTKKNQDLPTETVRTPDLAVLEIPISLTWTPHEKYLINYLNSGGENGVKNILADIVRERVRAWAMNHQEGPQTFEEALGSREEAVEILIKAVAGKELNPIPSRVPTTILFKYFNEPQISPTKSEERTWGKKWKRVDEILQKEDKANIEKEVGIRINQVKEIQRGNGIQSIPQLGITLNRLNIGDISIKEGTELEKAAEKDVKEKKEREAEKTELEHVRKRIKELKGIGYSLQEARDIVQTERKKVNKQIHDIQGLEGFGKGIGEALRRR
jgi:regulator of protease activity HflC (stomatin/prohibitin superfamily)